MASSSEDRGPPLAAYNAVMIAIPTIAVLVRFWSRGLGEAEKTVRFWWDDWIVLASLPFAVASNAMAIELTSLGLGRHIETLPPENIPRALKVLFATYLVYDTGLTLAKSSALLFYVRIFGTRSRFFVSLLWVVQGLVWAWWIGIIFGTVFICDPVKKNWDVDAPGHCGSTGTLWIGSAIPSVIIDFIILLLPMPLLWNLQLKTSRKIGVCGIFVCGYCVILVSIGRLITVIKSQDALNKDLTWAGVDSLYWLAAETPLTIVSVCLPSLFFLFRRIRDHGPAALFTVRLRSRYHSGSADSGVPHSMELAKGPKTSMSSQEQLCSDSLTGLNSNARVEISAAQYLTKHDLETGRPVTGIHVSSDFRVSHE